MDLILHMALIPHGYARHKRTYKIDDKLALNYKTSENNGMSS